MYKLERFMGDEARDFALEKEKKDKMQYKKMRIVCNILSIFLLVFLTYMNPKNFIYFFLIYGLGTGVMGNWAISHVKKREKKITEEISKGNAQYICIDGLECNVELKFETVESKIIERSFSKDTYGKYRKAKSVYIIYVPVMNIWCIEQKVRIG